MKKILGGLVALLLVFMAVSIGSHFLVDQNIIRQQVVQAVKQQTGSDLKMSQASFQLLPWPSFHADELSLSHRDCKPFMTARSAHADIAFLPLFHREIMLKNFTVEGGEASFLKEETCSVWPLSRSVSEDKESHKKDTSPSHHTPWRVSFNALKLEKISLEWGDKQAAFSPQGGRIFINHLILKDLKSTNPQIDLLALQEGHGFSLQGRLGPLHEVFAPSTQPWVFSLGLVLGEKSKNDQLTIDGVLHGSGHDGKATLTVQGHSDNLQDWKVLFPQAVLPDMRDLGGKITFRIDDDGSSGSLFRLWGYGLVPTALSLHVGQISLSSAQKQPVLIKELQLTADANAPDLKGEGILQIAPASWHFMANSGSPEQIAALWNGEEGTAVPLDVQIQDSKTAQTMTQPNHMQFQMQGQIGQQGSHVTVKGSGDQLQLPEMDFLPDFWKQSVSGVTLHDFTLNTDLSLGPVSEQKKIDTLSFETIQIKSKSLNGGGTLAFSRLTQSVPRFDAHLHFNSLDGNQFMSSGQNEKKSVREKGENRGSVSFLKGLVNLSEKWDGLADLKWDQFTLGGLTYHDVSLYGLMGDGKVTIDPVSARIDDIPLKGRLTFDQIKDMSRFHVTFESFLLPAPLLLKLLHQSEFLEGNVQLDGQISAEGKTNAEFIRSLEGPLGISLTEGRIQKSVLTPLVGPASSFLKLGKPSMKLRCLAGKMNFKAGQAEISIMAMQAKHYALEGKGKFDLTRQSVDLLLFPHVDLAGQEISTPLQVTGLLSEPRLVPARNEQGYFQMNVGGAERDSCADAVKEARGGHPGPVLEKEEKHSGKAEGVLKALGIGGKF